MTPELCVTTPYRENAIVAIGQAAARDAQLERFYTTLYLARLQGTVQRLPLVGSRLAQELGRRAFASIPAERVVNVAMLTELMHVGARRLLGDHRPSLAAGLMYLVKARFDNAVARRLRQTCPAALVGMYGASLESFRAVHRYGGLAVLNFVNSHPAEHNRYLKELAGLQAPHHELIPDWVSRRVEAELSLADLVLVPSRFVEEQLRTHGVASGKIAVLPYGVDLRAFHPAQQREPRYGPLECLYVGQISHRKGIRILLDAARRCRELPVRFRLIGPIVSADVLGDLPDNMVYEGASLPGGVAEAMRRADLFVLPTIEDACALVVLESMATGLPVVTTTNNGSGELIEDGRDGLIVPAGDAQALAEAIRNLVEQPELRHRLGEAARVKVQGAHSWESYGQSVLQVIENRMASR
jgi:glycosyltransferase involved in cell wall biosynthesis